MTHDDGPSVSVVYSARATICSAVLYTVHYKVLRIFYGTIF